jgi:probable selenium-dependent hydroxylase accessory protein YqeC
MRIGDALSLSTPELVAFVGAGGKKTAMKRLANDANVHGLRVGYTTTTHTPPPRYPLVLAAPERLQGKLERMDASPLAFARERVPNPDRADEKVKGFASAVINGVFQSDRFDWLCVKADGARRRGFKAPNADEPAIPNRSTVVVPVVSVGVVGHPLSTKYVHRVERVTELTDFARGEQITPETLGQVLSHPDGGLKGVPESARVVPLVNKADTEADRQTAREVLRATFSRTDCFERGIVASLRNRSLTVIEA